MVILLQEGKQFVHRSERWVGLQVISKLEQRLEWQALVRETNDLITQNLRGSHTIDMNPSILDHEVSLREHFNSLGSINQGWNFAKLIFPDCLDQTVCQCIRARHDMRLTVIIYRNVTIGNRPINFLHLFVSY